MNLAAPLTGINHVLLIDPFNALCFIGALKNDLHQVKELLSRVKKPNGALKKLRMRRDSSKICARDWAMPSSKFRNK